MKNDKEKSNVINLNDFRILNKKSNLKSFKLSAKSLRDLHDTRGKISKQIEELETFIKKHTTLYNETIR